MHCSVAFKTRVSHREHEHNILTGQGMVSDRIWAFKDLLHFRIHRVGWEKAYKREPDRQKRENALKLSKQELK